MAEAEWYYSQNGQQLGPVTLRTLQDMVRSGQVRSHDLAWRTGMANWQPINQLPALASVAGDYAPAPSARPAPTAAPPGFPPPPAYSQSVNYALPTGYGNGPDYSNKAASAFVLSLAAVVVCFFIGIVGFIVGIFGLVMAHNAKRGMRTTSNFKGRGLATAAQIISFCQLILLGISALFYAILAGR